MHKLRDNYIAEGMRREEKGFALQKYWNDVRWEDGLTWKYNYHFGVTQTVNHLLMLSQCTSPGLVLTTTAATTDTPFAHARLVSVDYCACACGEGGAAASLGLAMAILRNAQRIMKFVTDGPFFDSVMTKVKTTSALITVCSLSCLHWQYYQVEVVAASHGKCRCEVTLDESHLNRGGSLHGGFTATLVDSVSTVAVMCADKPPGVSVDMNIT